MDKLAVAESKEDMYSRRTEVDAAFHHLPVDINEVVLEGYEIIVKPTTEQALSYREDQAHIMKMSRDELKVFLNENKVNYVPQWGEAKLRELALRV